MTASGELSGRFAVTGAASGIGLGVARALAEAGAEVVLLDVEAERVARVASELAAEYQVLDIGDADQVATTFAAIGALQGVVCCAGVSEHAPLVDVSPADWRRGQRVNLDGTFFCLQAAARNMIAYGVAGTIVAVSSVNARFAHRGHAAYAAAKAGVEMLVKVAALEFAQAGVRVNAVAPGIVESGMTAAVLTDTDFVRTWSAAVPLGRLGRPDDIADVVVFLSSPRSRWLTGQVLSADGGGSLRVEPKIHPDDDWSPAALRALVDNGRSRS